METPLQDIIESYDSGAPVEEAWTIAAPFYTDPRISDLERRAVFGRSWQVVGRTGQVESPGDFITAAVADEPVVIVRGKDDEIRGFFNVCRHHAAAVMTEPCGRANVLRCPYHGWTYGLDGALMGAPEFTGVRDFDRNENGLVPIRVDTWEQFVFASLDPEARSLERFLGGLPARCEPLALHELHYMDSRVYDISCNWKVFVDNYLDGGYHVPHLHKGLAAVLEYKDYTIENEDRYSLQSSPMAAPAGADESILATRKGDRARYFWQYPNFMINCYEGYMDTNLVIPTGVDSCRVFFDFYFGTVGAEHDAANRRSIEVGHQVQMEDLDICEDVQRGLRSRAYVAGRLSARREAGEHFFHRLLVEDLRRGLRDE